MKTNSKRLHWLAALTMAAVWFSPAMVALAQNDVPSTMPNSASATAPPPPKSQMPLAPKLPIIEQLTQALFPSTPAKPNVDNGIAPPERLVRAMTDAMAELHFTLTDFKKREEFKNTWYERAAKCKTLDEADKVNQEMLVKMGQRFDYYRKPEAVDHRKKQADPTTVGIGVSLELQNMDEILDGLQEDTKPEDLQKMLTSSPQRPMVMHPFKGSPAEKAGIQDGDVLRKVDGKDINGMQISEISKLVRGTQGTKVELTVERKDKDGKPVDVKPISIVRDRYVPPVVHVRKLADNVTYIKLDNFVAERAAIEMQEALTEAGKVKDGKIVLDLRDNGGGRLDHAISIVANMLADGNIVTLRKREGYQMINEHYTATLDAIFQTRPAPWNAMQIHYSATARVLAVPRSMPIVVLTNDGTASASELTAGALQFHGRAKTVGQNSHGKGVGQRVVELPDGREASITIFYFDPADREIDFEGIHPDVEVSLEPTYNRITELRKELRALLKKMEDAQKRATTGEDKDKEAAAKEVTELQAKEKPIREELAKLHKELREDDAQLRAARQLAVEEGKRMDKEAADRKAKRDATIKKKTEEWEKERQQREEEMKKKNGGASSSASASAA